MAGNQLTVRAVYVGNGHAKFTNGFDDDGELKAESFPSQSGIVQGAEFKSEIGNDDDHDHRSGWSHCWIW